MKKAFLTMVLAGLLGVIHAQNNSNSFRESLLDPNNGEVFVIARRGDWHGTAENSLHAIQKAVEKGARVAWVDLQRTKDGELVLFSDATLERLTRNGTGAVSKKTLKELRTLSYKEYQGLAEQAFIPTWKEALAFARGKILLEVAPGAYLEQAVKEAAEAGALQDIIINGERPAQEGVMFIPVVDLDGENALQQLDACLAARPVAVELHFQSDDNALLPQALQQLKGRCRVCFNTAQEGSAGNRAEGDRQRTADQNWGSLIRQGGTLLVSNQIKPLLRFLNGEEKSEGPAPRQQTEERGRRPQGEDGRARGEGGRQQGRGARQSKPQSAELKAMIGETVSRFVQQEYRDEETGQTMKYNLFVPENYDEARSYPMIMFIGDASTVQPDDVTAPLTQGYGGIIWATAKEQAKHPCFVLVPQYSTVTVNDNFTTSYEVEMTLRLIRSLQTRYNLDDKRLYTTGQSMGGMTSMYFNVEHPDFFAASLYAGCQWDTSKMGHFAQQKFFYVVAAGDPKASVGMAELKKVLTAENASFSEGEWSAKLPREEQEAHVRELIAEGKNNNFVTFTLKSVLAEDGSGHEHMSSFDYVYKLEGVRDWLFEQEKN